MTLEFKINQETIKALKDMAKQTDKKVKPEYWNIHFCEDGYAYFPIYQAILRWKYAEAGQVGAFFANYPEYCLGAVPINCEDFLNMTARVTGPVIGNISIDDAGDYIVKVGKKIIGTPGDTKRIKNIGKLFYNEYLPVDTGTKALTATTFIKHASGYYGEWTCNYLWKHCNNNIDTAVDSGDERGLSIVYTVDGYDVLLVPVGIPDIK